MIHKFREAIPKTLYRGSAPNIADVKELKKLGVKKIVSLDQLSGDKIDRACKLAGIKHIKMYIDHTKKSLMHFLSQNLKQLLLEGGPTFVHCHEGKDRTGLACALVKCKYLGMPPEEAIDEAKSLGFGIGVPKPIVKLYEKIIEHCKPASKDNNAADSIVSNEQEYISDNRDSALDEGRQGSFAPYLDETYIAPYTSTYGNLLEQSPTRQNYHSQSQRQQEDENKPEPHPSSKDSIPTVGEYNNDAGSAWTGPTINMTGFIYD